MSIKAKFILLCLSCVNVLAINANAVVSLPDKETLHTVVEDAHVTKNYEAIYHSEKQFIDDLSKAELIPSGSNDDEQLDILKKLYPWRFDYDQKYHYQNWLVVTNDKKVFKVVVYTRYFSGKKKDRYCKIETTHSHDEESEVSFYHLP